MIILYRRSLFSIVIVEFLDITCIKYWLPLLYIPVAGSQRGQVLTQARSAIEVSLEKVRGKKKYHKQKSSINIPRVGIYKKHQ
jgi:hypothetical protein